MIYFDEAAMIHLFETEEETLERYRQFGYISAKAKELKSLYYKWNSFRFEPCRVIGFLVPADSKHKETIVVIEVLGQRGMIHKDYLKEMQDMKKKFDQQVFIQASLFKKNGGLRLVFNEL